MSKKGGSNSQITGYKYFFDFLMGICRSSVDSLVAIRAGDLPLWAGNITTTTQFSIKQGELFGGDTGEGGIDGTVTFMQGAADQAIPASIKQSIANGPNSDNEGNWSFVAGVGTSDEGATSEVASDISEFRGVTTLFYSGQIASNNPYPKLWKARTRRAVNGWGAEGCWYPEKAVINYKPNISAGSVAMWNASSNVPTLASGQGSDGLTYNVGVSGGTVLDGIPYWNTGEMASFNGGTGKWQKITSGETIIRAMNPAHILYQCLTNRSWGRGMMRDELDNEAWVYAANYLFNESFGLCIRWSKDGDISDFIQTIIDHIGAALYIDRGTGLMILRLIRKDYDHDALPVFDYSSGLISVDTQETGAATILANEIVVKWHDPIRDQERQTRVHNLASMQSLGYPISDSREFLGIPDPNLAQRIALRELQVGSAGVKRLKLRFDRRAWRIQPGMVMRIAAPDKGIVDMVVRVATYDDGTMLDGTITMDVLQDVFGLPTTIYAPPVDNSTVENPRGTAPPITMEIVQEASYLDMHRGLLPADFQAVTDTEGGIIAMAGRPNSISQYFAMFATPTGAAAQRTTGSYAPVGVVGRPMGYYDVNVFVSDGMDLGDLTIGMTGVLGETELVKVMAFTPTSGLIVVARGGGDTVPVPHGVNELVIFDDVVNSGHTNTFETGEVVSTQLQNITASARSDLSQALTHSTTIVARHFMPYVMGNIRLNGTPALSPSPLGVSGNAIFTWAARNRLVQADQFVAHGEDAVAAESGTTYTVEVWDSVANTLIRSHAGLSASTYTYDAAEKASGAPDPVRLTFVFYTIRSGTNSYNRYRIPVFYVGSGEGVGEAAGRGLAVAVGGTFVGSYGTATGISTTGAQGVGVGIATMVGNAAGFGSVIWPLAGSADGVGDAFGVGDVFGVTTVDGSASGVGAATAVSDATGFVIGRGAATGVGAAAGIGGYRIAAVGSASGVGTANAAGLSAGAIPAVGAASGTGAANATPLELPEIDGFGSGASAGTNTITAVMSTARTNNIIVLAVYAESANPVAALPVFTVSGGGLGWIRRSTKSLRAAYDNSPATMEVWTARALTPVHSILVTATSSITFDAGTCIWFGVHGVANLTTPFDPHGTLPVLNAYDDPAHLVPTGFFSTAKGPGGDIIFTVIASNQYDLDASNPGIGAQGQTHIATIQSSGASYAASMTALYRHDTVVNHHQPFGITNTVNNWIGVIDAFTAETGYAGSALGRGTATGISVRYGIGVGSAVGTGTANGVGSYFQTGVGAASGVGAATGVSSAVVSVTSGTGSASGVGVATGVGSYFQTGTGAASGVGVATGVSSVVSTTASGTGSASGVGAATGAGSTVVITSGLMITGVGVISL